MSNSLRLPRKMHFMSENEHGTCRCKESETLQISWQAQCFVDVAKTLAGVCHSQDCVSRGRRRESAPWMRYFEVKRLNS